MLLQIDWLSLLFQIVNFLVLLAILNRLLFKPLRKKLNERGRVMGETLQRARDQEAEAARLTTEWEEREAAAKAQAEETLRAAQSQALREREGLLQETRKRLDELTDEMREDLARQRDETIAGHYDDILDSIIALSGNVIQSVTTRRTHDDLVTNFAASIYQMPQADIEEYRRLLAGRIPTAFVVTPVALSEDQTKTLADTLSSLINRHMELQVNVDPSLIAGIQVRLGDKLMDNSLRQQLNRIRESVRQDLITRVGAGG